MRACISTATSISSCELSTLVWPILDRFMINPLHGTPASSKHNQSCSSSSPSEPPSDVKKEMLLDLKPTTCCHFLSSNCIWTWCHPLMTQSPHGTSSNKCHHALISGSSITFGLIRSPDKIQPVLFWDTIHTTAERVCSTIQYYSYNQTAVKKHTFRGWGK